MMKNCSFQRRKRALIKGSALALNVCILLFSSANAEVVSNNNLALESAITSKGNNNISVNFQDIPLRSLLQIIAKHKGFNLVVSDKVQGNLTLNLDNVSWQKALDTILQIKGLSKRQMGNILLIAPLDEMQEKQSKNQHSFENKEVSLLTSKVIKINYANAETLASVLGVDSQGSNQNGGINLLSKSGSVAVDTRTNSLIIKDTAQNIQLIKNLVKQLDIPVEQVEIEAHIVSLDQGSLDELGVRWGLSKIGTNYQIGGSIEGNYQIGLSNGNITSQIDNLLNVDLGAFSPNAANIAFQVASLGRDMLLDLELSALQAESKAEIISSPRLLTTNKHSAYIAQGTEIPYLEGTSSGATSVSFKKAVLSLNVKPQITHDKKIVLDLEVTQDKPASTVQAGVGEAVSIDTQRINTQVLSNDGETIVLGGIYQNEVLKIVDKVPLLGDIPFLGKLFSRSYETMVKRELLIFVTPKILVK